MTKNKKLLIYYIMKFMYVKFNYIIHFNHFFYNVHTTKSRKIYIMSTTLHMIFSTTS